MRKIIFLKICLYLFCLIVLIGSVLMMFFIFLNLILFGGIILYEFSISILLLEFICIIISFFIIPFIIYDLLLRKDIYI
ncbi:hypothetical protein LCGC14_1364920 [marine sediment metagenome]|uniref:Uncharacterized protein n=1 Tax=marine sediment metagenome TaxID=412755 RepID=A0A0F9KT46_9ZZZZ